MKTKRRVFNELKSTVRFWKITNHIHDLPDNDYCADIKRALMIYWSSYVFPKNFLPNLSDIERQELLR